MECIERVWIPEASQSLQRLADEDPVGFPRVPFEHAAESSVLARRRRELSQTLEREEARPARSARIVAKHFEVIVARHRGLAPREARERAPEFLVRPRIGP